MTGSGDQPPVARGSVSGSASSERLRVELCGCFGVFIDGRPVREEALRRSRPRAVLAMLALAPRFRLRREFVADALWPELDGDAACNQLAKAIHALRRAFEPDLAARAPSRYLASGDGMLTLTAAGGVSVDALEFRDAARFALAIGTRASLDSAVALLPAELLPEFHAEPWVMPLRDELRALSARVLERAARLRERAGEAQQAERMWQRLLEVEPASEAAFRGLLRAASARGDRTEALRVLEACREALKREFGVEPEPATVELARSVMQSTRVSGVSIGPRRETSGGPAAEIGRPAGEGPGRALVAASGSPPSADVRGMAAEHVASPAHPAFVPRWSRARMALAVTALVAATVVFVAATPPGRSVQRFTRKTVRAATALVTGQPAEPQLVVLAGSGVAPNARVDVVGSRSGLATYADAEGRFSLPGVAWRPGQAYRIAVSQDGVTAWIVQVAATAQPSDRGVVDVGLLPATGGQTVELERVSGLNSFALVDFERDAYLAGVVRAVTAHAASDAERIGALDAFVASLYDPQALDPRTPHQVVASGSGRASDLSDAMAALARGAGYRSRLVDVGDPDRPGLTYPLVEVSYEGAWHLHDPATGTKFTTGDGRVPSFAEVQRQPGTVRLAEPNGRTYWNAGWLERLYASPLHRYRELRGGAPLVG